MLNTMTTEGFTEQMDRIKIKGDPDQMVEVKRTFMGARTLFVRPVVQGKETRFEDTEDTIRIPEEYSPDTEDRFYRPPQLKTQKKEEYFHIIASGNFADIISARREMGNSSISVACKRYRINKLNDTIDGYTRLRREIQISRFHRHENIVKFYETFVEYENDASKDPTHIWLVTERMDHTLEKYFEHLRRKDDTSSPVMRDLRHMGALLTQLLRALDYLHQRGIMHRDVTPRNIGMNQREFEIKLLDFGLARETNAKLDHSTNVDTPYIYKPLEVFMRARYDTKVDVWAAGLVAIEMLGEKLFMPSGNDAEVTQKIRKRGAENAVKDRIFEVLGVPEDGYQKIFNTRVQWPVSAGEFEKIWTVLEKRLDKDIGPLKKAELKNLIKQMLDVDMKMRPRADECLQHPFLRILNEKYEQRANQTGNGQPKNDEEMRARNERDKKALVLELSIRSNQRLQMNESSF